MKTRSLGLMGVSTLALMISGLPQAVQAAAAAPAATDAEDTIIVTGTRDVGVKAQDSATPIEVIGAEDLQATGATTAFDALKSVLPSFSADAFNGDSGAIVRAARLRGMNPGEVLVLVDGKRRHQAANIIPAGSDESPDSGSNSTDLDMIPVSLIDHVEVLLDGASAQYGSDAVSGVINIILKHSASGTYASALGGVTTYGDGANGTVGASQGIALGADGFLDISADYRHQDFSNRNGINCRTYASGCGPNAGGPGLTNIYGQVVPPTRNRIVGTPLSDLTNLGFNAEKPINDDITVYGFGTFGRRTSQAYENDRPANKAPVAWPDGFYPRMELNEVDYAVTGGIKGSHLLGWDWDLSATYGKDSDHFSLANSYNTGLSNPIANGGLGQYTSFTGGPLSEFTADQTTVNADLRRSVDVPLLAGPLNVATGFEFRHEGYTVGAGDFRTYIQGGTQAEAGVTPTDASSHSRNIEAVYADLSAKVLPKWTADLAGRFENDDQVGVGSTETGKFTNRYDITPQFGVRGTISTGFHAPSLAQSYYSQTGVTPTFLSITAPPTSPGAKLLGAQPLVPETSKDVSFGIVAEPVSKFHVTADAYQIFLDHQIIGSASVGGALATQGAALNGNILPPGTAAGISYFNNGIDTRTRGLDISADYRTDFDKYGFVKWTMAANFNSVAITREYAVPAATRAALLAAGAVPSFLNPQVRTDITKSSPTNKVTVAADYTLGDFNVVLRETRYGHADETNDCGCSSGTAVTPFSNIYIKSAYITDVDLGYNINDHIKLDLGGNNVFNHLPGHVPYTLQQSSRASALYPYYTPYGINGGYYFVRVTASY